MVNNNLKIEVPRGGSLIQRLTIAPNRDGPWVLKANNEEIENLLVVFSPESDALERKFERCVAVVSLDQLDSATEVWRFFQNGILLERSDPSPEFNIRTDVSIDGNTLTMIFSNVPSVEQSFDYQFIAMLSNVTRGQSAIYQSRDPKISFQRVPP